LTRGIGCSFSGYWMQKFQISLLFQHNPALKLLNSLSTRESFLNGQSSTAHVCKAVEKRIGQPYGLKFFVRRGLRPACTDAISASSPVKSGSGIFRQERAKNLPVPRQKARFDRLRALRLTRFCRDGTRNGLFRSEQGTASKGRKKGAWQGVPVADFATRRQRSTCISPFFRLRRGALATCWMLSPRGGEAKRGSF
jgi:hypothetical protein